MPDVAHHQWSIDEREYARHEARRGRRHAYAHLHPRRTALVVVDLVPFVVQQSAYVRGIAPQVNALAAAMRWVRRAPRAVLSVVEVRAQRASKPRPPLPAERPTAG